MQLENMWLKQEMFSYPYHLERKFDEIERQEKSTSKTISAPEIGKVVRWDW